MTKPNIIMNIAGGGRQREVIREIPDYIIPATERSGQRGFERFDAFYGYSKILNPVLAPEGKRLYSPAAELIKRQATRADLPFSDLIQADLLTLLMAFITPDLRWYPQLMHYANYTNEFPFFIRAAQHKHFQKLAVISGIDDANALRKAVKEGHERLQVGSWHDFSFVRDFSEAMSLDKLDTIK